MKGAIALILMSLVSVNSVYASDEKNKKETKRFIEVIENGAGPQIFCIVLPNDKKDSINDSNEHIDKSKTLSIHDSKKIIQLPLKLKRSGKDYTGLRFVSGTPYTPVVSKL